MLITGNHSWRRLVTVNYRWCQKCCQLQNYVLLPQFEANDQFESAQLAIVKSCSFLDWNHRTILHFSISKVRKLWFRRTRCGIRKGKRAGLIRILYRTFYYNPKIVRGGSRSLSKKKQCLCRSDTNTKTQQHKAGYKNFIFKSLPDTPFEKKGWQKIPESLSLPSMNTCKFCKILQPIWRRVVFFQLIFDYSVEWALTQEVISGCFWLVHSTLMIWQISLTKTAAGSFFLPPPQSLKFRPRATRKQKSNQNRAALLHSRVPLPVGFIWVVFFQC